MVLHRRDPPGAARMMPPLATRCPNCQAVFRVIVDQLRLREGLVRCGACATVFDATADLAHMGDTDPLAIKADGVAAEGHPGLDAASREAPIPAEPDHAKPAPTEPSPQPEQIAPPEFLRRDPPAWKRTIVYALATGSALLLTALALQAVVRFRSEIASNWPQMRPALERLCEPLSCQVEWPARGELLAVMGSELQSLPNTEWFELDTVVRNRESATMELPSLELTLSDSQNQPIARRVFRPPDYLDRATAASQIAAGFAAGADLNIRLTFEAQGLKVAGFVVYPFYP
jgi:predicted Zn finger-like uncharacterized protein